MLATYGTSSFGSIHSIGGFTPGFFPWKERSRAKYKKLAQRVARTVLMGNSLPTNAMQRRMYKVMKRKMSGAHAVNCMQNGLVDGQPAPNRLRVRLMRYFFKKVNLTEEQLSQLTRLAVFELDWWRARGWLHTCSFKELAARPIPHGFSAKTRLLDARLVSS
jgi:hypothetical protein